MIARRSLLALLGALPFVGIPAAGAVVQADDDPVVRLRRWQGVFERQMEHHWHLKGPGEWTYYGSGEDGRWPPAGVTAQYHHRQYIGRGDTALEAVDDWFAQLPKENFHAIFWRTMPELSFHGDLITQRTEWRVYSTFALVPMIETSAARAALDAGIYASFPGFLPIDPLKGT